MLSLVSLVHDGFQPQPCGPCGTASINQKKEKERSTLLGVIKGVSVPRSSPQLVSMHSFCCVQLLQLLFLLQAQPDSCL